ncbi:MAG: hypothetical protein A2V58_05630 [Candidatus Muproteobacteria bacterium RBG_19FT_COMBO_61_10]|uniref:Stress-response A/B barrel domain-containing protein n=1 Tax=Candidatus Muproteobacteria bacterium RBG_19FT_COMBO_61_10 TaxID=1817761 RepID=A0A1F6UPS8_9PROT|nr:MAG: hypothetical protein A2V58_05630 [Candidatus Muproteobacteria bacterium RBG_19FT_COMBO_61_10]
MFTGWAMQDQAKYRFCWLVQFSHSKVVDSYRDHPEHVAFASEYFRPIAADRLSIDFADAAVWQNPTVQTTPKRARR